jgi:uncharacterized protein DUF5677
VERNEKNKEGQQKESKRSNRRHVLRNHVQYGKKFRPPLLDYMLTAGHGPPNLEWVRWVLPEVLWIGLLIRKHGIHRAGELVHAAVKAGRNVVNPTIRSYCLASDYVFKEKEQEKFIDALGGGPLSELSQAFAAFVKSYRDFPMAWMVQKTDLEGAAETDELENIKRLVLEMLSRRDRPAMEIQVCALFSIVATGILSLRDVPDLNLISEYPETEPSKLMGSRVRSILNVFFASTTDSAWATAFWECGRRISQCEVLKWDVALPNPTALMEANQAGTRFARAVFVEIQQLAEMFLPDAHNPSRSEVLLGLLQRQGLIAADIARMPTLTMSPWAEMGQRAMAETLIRLKWLAVQDSPENYEWFVNYGLGQEKLYIEHLKTLVENREVRPDYDEILAQIEARESWLSYQRFSWLQEVDVGGGTHDKDLRKLAEEAGCGDLRNLVFQPMSAVVHGHWNAIAQQNLTLCYNPLHGIHRLPYEYARPIQLSVVAAVLDLYSECYLVVSALAGTQSINSAAVEAWYREANETKGWDLYASSEDISPQQQAAEGTPQQAQQPDSAPEEELDSKKRN